MEFTLPHRVDAVRRVMSDPAVIKAWETSQGALEVEVEERDDGCEVKVVRHAITVNGMDPSSTETVTAFVTWDPEEPIRRWKWKGSALFAISGRDLLVAEGRTTKLRLGASVASNVPSLGKPLELRVREGFAEAWPRYVDLLKRHLRK